MPDDKKMPAALGYRMPAEWEPHAATWLSWPRREGISFPDAFDRVLPTLRRWSRRCSSPSRCASTSAMARMKRKRVAVLDGLPQRTAHVTIEIPTNEPWCRDHGPIFLTRDDEPRLAIVDWDYNAWGGKYPPCDLDDVVPTRVARIPGVCRSFIRG